VKNAGSTWNAMTGTLIMPGTAGTAGLSSGNAGVAGVAGAQMSF
jgi:hypothetical protein